MLSPIETSKEILWNKYFHTFNFYFSKPITEIIADVELPHVSLFKDYLYYDDEREFLRRSYTTSEFQERHKLLCSLYNNLDFMTRPNLAVHSQNNIILKRNLKLQKMFFTKLSAGVDRDELLAQQIPVIPRYIEDIVYSSNAESETPKTGQMTGSLDQRGMYMTNVLNSLRQQEENASIKSYETAIYNGHDSRYSIQMLSKENSNKDEARRDSLHKFAMEMKGLKDSEPVSLGSSFNTGYINPQHIHGNPSTPGSHGLTPDDLDFNFFYTMQTDPKAVNRLTGTPQNEIWKPSETNQPTEIIKPNHVTVKKRTTTTRNSGQLVDPKVVFQNFSKKNDKSPVTEAQSAAKGKVEQQSKKPYSRNLMEMAHAEMKKEMRNEYQEQSLADKILTDKLDHASTRLKNIYAARETNLKERGVNLRVSSSPKLHKIDLSKSPPRDHPLTASAGAQSQGSGKNSVFNSQAQAQSRLREERSPVNHKLSPATAKIYLSHSPNTTRNENSDASANNNKSIIPSIKNLVMKYNNKKDYSKQGNEGFLKTFKDRDFDMEKLSDNPLFSRPDKDERLKRTYLAENYKANHSKFKGKSQESHLSSNTTTRIHEVDSQIEGLASRGFVKGSPRQTLQILNAHKPQQNLSDANSPTAGNESKLTNKNKESFSDKLSGLKSQAPSPQFFGNKDSAASIVLKTSPDELTKRDTSLTKIVPSKPNTRGSSLSNYDFLKKTVKIDMQVKSDAETRAETRGQSHESRVHSDESEIKDHAEHLRRKSSSKDSLKLVYVPVKVPPKKEFFSSAHTSPKRAIDLKINLDKMQSKSHKKSQDASTLQAITSGRSGHVLTEESKPSRGDLER